MKDTGRAAVKVQDGQISHALLAPRTSAKLGPFGRVRTQRWLMDIRAERKGT